MSAAPSPKHTPSRVSPQPWEKIAAYSFGVMFIAALLILAIAFPEPTSFQYTVFRIVLALACGGVASVVPGFLAVRMDTKGLAIRAGGALAVFLLVYFFTPAQLVLSTSSLDVGAIVRALEEKHSIQLALYESQLASSNAQAEYYREQNKEFTKALANAVAALGEQRGKPNAPSGIEDALAQLRQGNTKAAETIFETVLTRKAAEGQAANQEAAEAARHLGALAFLHNTEKALTAYRHAVALDPHNGEGWMHLGRLLYRVGQLNKAADAYLKVLALGEETRDEVLVADSYNGLGIVYWSWSDFKQAEAMFRKALALNEALGRKEGIAAAYANLGMVYWGWDDFKQAEAMQRKALELNEALGRKEGIAGAYANLGDVSWDRGDLDQAEVMYRQALALFQEIGAAPQMAQTQQLLRALRAQGLRKGR